MSFEKAVRSLIEIPDDAGALERMEAQVKSLTEIVVKAVAMQVKTAAELNILAGHEKFESAPDRCSKCDGWGYVAGWAECDDPCELCNPENDVSRYGHRQ